MDDPFAMLRILKKKAHQDTSIIQLWKSLEGQFGGPENFAKSLKLIFDDPQIGAPTKARMAIAFIELHNKAADLTMPTDPVAELDNAQLESIGKLILEQSRGIQDGEDG